MVAVDDVGDDGVRDGVVPALDLPLLLTCLCCDDNDDDASPSSSSNTSSSCCGCCDEDDDDDCELFFVRDLLLLELDGSPPGTGVPGVHEKRSAI